MTKKFEYSRCSDDAASPAKRKAWQEMIDTAVPVSYATMFRHCIDLLEWAAEHGFYTSRPESRNGKTLKRSSEVTFHRSQLIEEPCYYLVWEGKQFLWLPPRLP